MLPGNIQGRLIIVKFVIPVFWHQIRVLRIDRMSAECAYQHHYNCWRIMFPSTFYCSWYPPSWVLTRGWLRTHWLELCADALSRFSNAGTSKGMIVRSESDANYVSCCFLQQFLGHPLRFYPLRELLNKINYDSGCLTVYWSNYKVKQ